MPSNPYKNLWDDGVNIPRQTILNPGEIPQRALNGTLAAVPSGTAGQVPTYQADGTLAPADSGGGISNSNEDNFNHYFIGTVSVGTINAGASHTLSWDSSPNILNAVTNDSGDMTTYSWDSGTPTEINFLVAGLYEYEFNIFVKSAASATLAAPGILNLLLDDNSAVQDIMGILANSVPNRQVVNTATSGDGDVWTVKGTFQVYALPCSTSFTLQAVGKNIVVGNVNLSIVKIRNLPALA